MPIINGGFVTPAETSPPLIIQRNQQLPPIREDDNNSLKPPSINTEPDNSRPIVVVELEPQQQHSPK
uniref:Uncharacterized protein n=1 Tax=Panagrolaimus davidi TaxID=227884 RepID=A0A914QB42_9BILA